MKMKNYLFGAIVIIGILFIMRYAVLPTTETFTNDQLEALYESVPGEHFGFNSSDYYLTSHEADVAIAVPVSEGRVFITNVSGQEEIFYTPGGGGSGVEISSLGKKIEVFYKAKNFFTMQPIKPDYPIKFSMTESTIDESSFAFISGHYDFHGEVGGLFFNGEFISQRIKVGDDVPFLPLSVKKVGKKIIIHFTSANRASLYTLFNEKTKNLTLPVDYELIENDWMTAAKKIKDN